MRAFSESWVARKFSNLHAFGQLEAKSTLLITKGLIARSIGFVSIC